MASGTAELKWVLICFGITVLLTRAHVTRGLRALARRVHPELGVFAGCPMCVAFWVGGALGWSGRSPTGNVLLDAVYGSATTFVAWALLWAVALRHESPGVAPSS